MRVYPPKVWQALTPRSQRAHRVFDEGFFHGPSAPAFGAEANIILVVDEGAYHMNTGGGKGTYAHGVEIHFRWVNPGLERGTLIPFARTKERRIVKRLWL